MFLCMLNEAQDGNNRETERRSLLSCPHVNDFYETVSLYSNNPLQITYILVDETFPSLKAVEASQRAFSEVYQCNHFSNH
jgi:hypothetical protein